ncbi:MAG: hypothetical protein O7B35_17065 [Deltaproteobacteria bacterium]|nr:hypothetical protein [Deltaproteobacteria bacterium]
MTPNALLKKALLNPNAPDLLEEIRNRASEIIEALDAESEDANLFDIAVEDLDPAWTATIFEALSNSEELPPEEQAIREMLVNATDAAEERIGHAFAEALFEGLPAYLTQFENMLREAKIALIDPELRAELLKTPSLRAADTWPEVARKAADALADRGMTPLTLFYTTEAVWEIIDRFMYYGDLSRDIPVVLRFEEDELYAEPDPRLAEIILEETQVLCQCEAPTAKLLLRWVLQVAVYKPFIFRRFEAESTTTGLSLTPAEHDYEELLEELFERWQFPALLGVRLEQYAEYLENDTARRREFRLALKEAYDGLADTAEELINMAHEHEWPPWAVTCLPDLCISLDKQPDKSEVMLVWKTILSYVPDVFEYEKLDSFCEDAIHKVNMPKETADFIRRLADYIEPARGSHPFASELSLEGAINDVVSFFQLQMEMEGETDIARTVDEKRKEYLVEELELAVA